MRLSTSLFIVLLAALTLHSQSLNVPSLSQFSEIKQNVGLTTIALSYSRPSAKGRVIFGDLVPFGKIWRTGANASTKLTFEEDVKINGKSLPAGTYSLYTIPGEDLWTIIIHKKTDMRSIAGDRVKKENDAMRFAVKPLRSDQFVETFTIQVTDIRTQSCNIQLAWENTLVNIPVGVEVDAKIDAQMYEFLKDPESLSHRVYFRAAEYYLHNGMNLETAMEWIDAALVKSKDNFRYGLLKAKIYNAQGNKAEARKTVTLVNEWAKASNNSNYEEQTRLYLESIDKETYFVTTNIWHIKAIHPDGRTIDVKALDKEGNIYNVKAIQDVDQQQILDIKAFIGGKRLSVKILVSEDEFAPVKAIGEDGTIYDIKALPTEGGRLDVKGVRRAGNIIDIKAINQDGAFYGVKAISPDGQLSDVKGVKMSKDDVETVVNGVNVYAHVKALTQVH